MSPADESPFDPTARPEASGSPDPAEEIERDRGAAEAESAGDPAESVPAASASEAGSDEEKVAEEASTAVDEPVEAAVETPKRKKKPTRRTASKRSRKGKGRKTASPEIDREAASSPSEARGGNDAFPFLANDAVDTDVDIAGHDETIAGLADDELMRSIEHDGAAAVAMAVAEAAAAARQDIATTPPAAPTGATATDAAPIETAATPASVSRLAGILSTWFVRGRALLGAKVARDAVRRSALAAGLALAAGIGYGAAVSIFFDGDDRDLNVNPVEESNLASSAVDSGSKREENEVPVLGETAPTVENETHGAPPNDAELAALGSGSEDPSKTVTPKDGGDAAQHGGDTTSSDPVTATNDPPVDGDESNRERTESGQPTITRIVGPEMPFSMPEIHSPVPRKEHPLANGRERLDRGDLEAARRIAADFLLREDGLSSEDRLFVAQAYALLADSLKVDLDRSRANASSGAKANEAAVPSRPLPKGTEEGP